MEVLPSTAALVPKNIELVGDQREKRRDSPQAACRADRILWARKTNSSTDTTTEIKMNVKTLRRATEPIDILLFSYRVMK